DVEFHVEAGGVCDHQLDYAEFADVVAPEGDPRRQEAGFHAGDIGATEGDVVEVAPGAGLRVVTGHGGGIHQVDHRLVAGVEPVARDRHRRAGALPEADDVDIEIPQPVEQRLGGVDIDVVEILYRHGLSLGRWLSGCSGSHSGRWWARVPQRCAVAA